MDTPTVGESYSLMCTVYQADGPVTSYLWRKDSSTIYTAETAAILSFAPFRLSDTGQYTCEVTIEKKYDI